MAATTTDPNTPTAPTTPTLPHWDVTDVFPNLGSREYAAARESLGAALTRLTALYDEHDVRGADDQPIPTTDESVHAVDAVTDATNALMEDVRRLAAFLTSYVSTDTRDDAAQGEFAQLQAELAQLQRLRTRFDAWIARHERQELAQRSTTAADHAYPFERAAERAAHQMSEAEEGLLADLTLTGGTAWQRLYVTFTSQVVVDVPDHGRMSMSQARNLAYAADATTRRNAYEAELEAWRANEVPIIAALNAIKAETSLINRRRNWDDDLEPALAANGVDRATLDAMQRAVVASFPDFRRYLRAKARLLNGGNESGLPFHDLFAPVGDAPTRDWTDATNAVEAAFASYSQDLAQLARRAVDGKWIDAEPRQGKRDGAFCMGIEADRSLVFLNYDGSFRSVQTLAHELGHAYHNVTLAGRTPLQRQLPMALAETASIFCETVMVEAGLAAAATGSDSDRLTVIEGDLMAACQVVVDIHSRFLFESRFFEARRKRTVSATEACDLMEQAQVETYGDGMAADARHPYMWAAKPHYYSSTFYNWPYTFGLLFGLGLYARYREDPERFRANYDDLLSSVGLASARDLAGRFGIDVADEAFWTASLDVMRSRVDEFVRVVEATAP